MRELRHWTSHWDRIAATAREPHVFVGCDFDGTLAAIVARPEDARLSAEARALLSQLAALPGVTLAIVSGRKLADVRARVAIDKIFYCGNHGLEIEGPGIKWSSAEARTHRSELVDALAELRSRTATIQGIIIEDKGFTATVHWRLIPYEIREDLREVVASIVQSRAGLRLAHGKAIWEIRPRVEWNKGSALQFLLQRSKVRPSNAFYLGDDDTDETAFRVLEEGFTLRVGGLGSTAARIRLNDPADTISFLFCLYGARRGSGRPVHKPPRQNVSNGDSEEHLNSKTPGVRFGL
jgi:trehalose 6-phosphate phosphatase